MKLISWNVNGLRASVRKDFLIFFETINADIFAVLEIKLFKHIHMLDQKKAVILCSDLNVAHKQIDLKYAKANKGNSGFTVEEREAFTRLLDRGFTDILRYFEPDTEGLYTWWSYRKIVRERNIGWRIDYFLTSKQLNEQLMPLKPLSIFTVATTVRLD